MHDLNLLSPEQKSVLRDATVTHRLSTMFMWLLLMFIIDCVLLYGAQVYLSQRRVNFDRELASTKVVSPTGKTLPVVELTKQINQQLNTLKSFSRYDDAALPLTDVALKAPPGAKLSSLSYNARERVLTMQGTASTRNDIPQFERELKSLSYVEKVTTLTNLNERTNITFTTTVSLGSSVSTPTQ